MEDGWLFAATAPGVTPTMRRKVATNVDTEVYPRCLLTCCTARPFMSCATASCMRTAMRHCTKLICVSAEKILVMVRGLTWSAMAQCSSDRESRGCASTSLTSRSTLGSVGNGTSVRRLEAGVNKSRQTRCALARYSSGILVRFSWINSSRSAGVTLMRIGASQIRLQECGSMWVAPRATVASEATWWTVPDGIQSARPGDKRQARDCTRTWTDPRSAHSSSCS